MANDKNLPVEVKILKNLPLTDLISAPLNAVINAQAAAAMTTANFIERVGFINKKKKSSGLFDKPSGPNGDDYDVRVAKLKMVKKMLEPAKGDPAYPDGMRAATGNPDPSSLGPNPSTNDGNHPNGIEKYVPPKAGPDTYEYVELPFISMLTIPSFEVNELTWDFNVRLNSVEEFSTDFTYSNTTTVTETGDLGLDIADFLTIGASMKVESTTKTDFNLRYGSTHEAEYNLKINLRASAAQTPKGIDRLLSIAERIATNNEKVNATIPK